MSTAENRPPLKKEPPKPPPQPTRTSKDAALEVGRIKADQYTNCVGGKQSKHKIGH
ncbi:MAG TPA: hypothetical protein VI795_03010 [Patescibacteria group bacterium]|nr:hypothetical protein [Patescibacteria group bacterium]